MVRRRGPRSRALPDRGTPMTQVPPASSKNTDLTHPSDKEGIWPIEHKRGPKERRAAAEANNRLLFWCTVGAALVSCLLKHRPAPIQKLDPRLANFSSHDALQWMATHRGGAWGHYTLAYAGFDGDTLAALTKESFVDAAVERTTKSAMVMFAAWRELNEAASTASTAAATSAQRWLLLHNGGVWNGGKRSYKALTKTGRRLQLEGLSPEEYRASVATVTRINVAALYLEWVEHRDAKLAEISAECPRVSREPTFADWVAALAKRVGAQAVRRFRV